MLEARAVEAIKAIGPRNITALAVYLGIPKETCRYIVKRRLPAVGLEFSVLVDYGAIGLRRVFVLFRASSPESWFRNLFTHEVDGKHHSRFSMIYFARLMPSGEILASFGLPPDMVIHLQSLFEKLRKFRLVEEYRIIEASYFDAVSVSADYYDFENARWKIPWDTLRVMEAPPEYEEQPRSAEFDHIDMQILKQLQIDATSKLSGIAKSMGITRNMIARHHKDHVLGKNMIRRYWVSWSGKVERSKIRGILATMWHIRYMHEENSRQVRNVLYSHPFTYSVVKSRTGDEMFAFALIPAEEMGPSQQFLTHNLPKDVRCEMHIVDYSFVGSYVIPYDHYDAENMKWKPGLRGLLREVENLLTSRGL